MFTTELPEGYEINADVTPDKIINLINEMIKHFNKEHEPKYPIKFNVKSCIIGLNKTTVYEKDDENNNIPNTEIIRYWPSIQIIIEKMNGKKKLTEQITISNRRIIELKGEITQDNEETINYNLNSKIYCMPTILRYCGLVRFEDNKFNDCLCIYKKCSDNCTNYDIECLECFKNKQNLNTFIKLNNDIYCGSEKKCLIYTSDLKKKKLISKKCNIFFNMKFKTEDNKEIKQVKKNKPDFTKYLF